MDRDAFDELSRRLITVRMTRTSALRGLVGGAVALVGGVVALESAEAKKKRKNHKKGKKGRGHVAKQAGAYANKVTYSGQGLIADGGGGYALQTEICGIENGADADGPYLLWVLTATGASKADITFSTGGPEDGTHAMTKFGNGTFKYISAWLDPSSLPGNVVGTYDGKAKNVQLVISHGCRPFTTQGAWCSPGFWKNAEDAAWTLTGVSKTAVFNSTVYDGFYGAQITPATTTIGQVVGAAGNTYGGPSAGTDPRTQAPNPALNPFNAAGAYLTDHIPGYTYDPNIYVNGEGTFGCPIDHHGDYKCCDPANGLTCPPQVTCR